MPIKDMIRANPYQLEETPPVPWGEYGRACETGIAASKRLHEIAHDPKSHRTDNGRKERP